MSVTVGIKGRAEDIVHNGNTAQAACSGALPVFGTPFMCALMEKAAWTSIAPYLNEGEGTVGTKLNISHDSASPVGMKVWVEAYDEKGLIGKGTHERFIIANERFLAKTQRKLEG